MKKRNFIRSIVRTGTQLLTGLVVAQAARVGLTLPENALAAVFTPAVTLGVVTVLRLLEEALPDGFVRAVAQIFLGGGESPDYEQETS